MNSYLVAPLLLCGLTIARAFDCVAWSRGGLQAGVCTPLQQCRHLALFTPKDLNLACMHRGTARQLYVCCPHARSALQNRLVPDEEECERVVGSLPPPPYLSTACCGRELDTASKIIGGTSATMEQYPWLALLQYERGGSPYNYQCAGFLVSARYVLSAAHCVLLGDGDVIVTAVRLAEYDTSSGPTDYVEVEGGGVDSITSIDIPVDEVIPHPGYNQDDIKNARSNRRRNDISLIRLADAAPYTEFIRPICLPHKPLTPREQASSLLYVAGWGRLSLDVGTLSSTKQHVAIRYVPRHLCQLHLRRYTNIELWNGQICAGDRDQGGCHGDSGGPLMLERLGHMEAVGLVSYGLNCSKLAPTVYTNIFTYVDWIKDNIH